MTIASLISSIEHISQAMNQKVAVQSQSLGNMPPTGSLCMYYAAVLLTAHGRRALMDEDWLIKVESMRQTLCIMAQRWKVAGE